MRFLLGGLLWVGAIQASVLQYAPLLGAAGNITGAAYSSGAAQSGVARLIFTNGALCSGVAIAPTVVLTAAHCIGGSATGANAFFTDSGVNSWTFNTASFLVHPSWTGNPLTQVDLALVFLTSPLASWVSIYDLYSNMDEVGQTYQVAGWGEQSSFGLPQGSIASAGAGVKVGNNLWDATFAPFAPFVPPAPPRDDILVSDFDDGTAANNGWAVHFPLLNLSNVGVANEATFAPGDSGGPSFLGGRVAGITSFSATFNPPVRGAFGEFNGATRVSSHLIWINQNAGTTQVPEPASLGFVGLATYLIWAAKRRPNIDS